MNKLLPFDFSVDNENKVIYVKREFAAPRATVWSAWTESRLLDQWWAPKPYRVKTKTMDFREGGCWHYAMVSPEGQEHWCRADYQSITEGRFYSALDAFCDAEGNITTDFPRMTWHNTFSETGEHTLVSIEIRFDKQGDLEKIMEMGFREGFTAGLGNLDELLARNRQ